MLTFIELKQVTICLNLFIHMTLSKLLIVAVCKTGITLDYEHCNCPVRGRALICGSKVEHQSTESVGLKFDSSLGLRMFTSFYK